MRSEDADTDRAVDAFFANAPEAVEIYRAIRRTIVGEVDVRVSRSQIALRASRPFAWIWRPGQYLKGRVAPLVLSVSLPERDPSSRWKEIVEPRPGRFVHHLELAEPAEVDHRVEEWLARARAFAS